MADDNNSRYRSNDSFGRGPAPSGHGSDPLAELAKLIGRNDPFSEHGRDSRAPSQHDAGAAYASEPPRYADDPTLPRFGGDPAPRHGDYTPRLGNEHPPQSDWQAGSGAAHPFSHDPFALPSASPMQPAPHSDERHYDSPAYQAPGAAQEGYPPEHPGLDAAYQQPSDLPPFPPSLYPSEPETGAMPPPHDDEFYDDAPRGGRRKGMITIAAVLGLAVLGTAGAFAYRSIFGGAGSSGPPPIIRASNEPSKVAPPPASVDPAANKISYDRFGDRGQNEQVVVREEKPIDAKDLASATGPAGLASGASVANAPPANANTQGANPPSALGEPRRVRTVPIRPDQTDAAGSRPAQIASAPPPRQTNAAASSTPLESAPPRNASPPPPPAARPAPPARVAARTPPPSPPPQPANAPLSLSPDANAAAAPPARASAPPRSASPPRAASAPAGTGRYSVQVSSQKSEADAEASYRNIRSKYSSVLDGHNHVIRRADLGSRGVYYRAMVGSFGTRDQATQLCSSLKAAGGDCVVQSN
jgi:hypothetical protein